MVLFAYIFSEYFEYIPHRNIEEVVDWMMSLHNGRFLKYETKLRNCLTQMNYRGEYLSKISVHEIRTFGVDDYFDSKTLFRDIKLLRGY